MTVMLDMNSGFDPADDVHILEIVPPQETSLSDPRKHALVPEARNRSASSVNMTAQQVSVAIDLCAT